MGTYIFNLYNGDLCFLLFETSHQSNKFIFEKFKLRVNVDKNKEPHSMKLDTLAEL